jgi:hypothetical protein
MTRPLRLRVVAALQLLFGPSRRDEVIQGWRDLRARPGVIADLCTLGHVFETDIDPATGRMVDDRELVARAARRSLVLVLLARAEITNDELTLIRQENRDDHSDALYDDRD